jgi:acetylornithine/succinyldiaminopimelate/putrescine aminotransferase
MDSRIELLRSSSGPAFTYGLSSESIESFLSSDPNLDLAIDEAMVARGQMDPSIEKLLLSLDEADFAKELQKYYVNFYEPSTVNPYVPLAAKGPWIVTTHGAVIHDNGGYGMLGMGHSPSQVMSAMSEPHVMANVMTPSLTHMRFAEAIRAEVGHSRGNCPFDRFICMNSGSESVTVAMRIADVNARLMTDEGGPHEGKEIWTVALDHGFHGRTDRPASISDSCLSKYRDKLASFRNREGVKLVPPNDIGKLQSIFKEAEKNNAFIELVAMEPVMGEGNPGLSITRDFYDMARNLSDAHGSFLLIDSIQAGLRGQGCLSIVDYPGFEDCEVPDFETWSKALNAGQYPLSVLGMSERASKTYVVGVYGNTMTTNPRSLETAISVLEHITPELRQNIRERGKEFVSKLEKLSAAMPGCITKVQGTGLLLSAELDPARFAVVGVDGVEQWCRRNGLGVIHGGINALRFTPHFLITSEEIDMIVSLVESCLKSFMEDDQMQAEAILAN